MSLKSLSKSVMPLTNSVFKRKYVKLGKIFSLWPQIIGNDYKDRAYPSALKPRKRKDSLTFVLQIVTSSANAQTLYFQKELILGRLEHLFGEAIISDIDIKHGGFAKQKATTPQKNLSETEQNELEQMISGIDDPDLRKSLEHFGQSLYLSRK